MAGVIVRGGPGSQSTFRFQWNGPAVYQKIAEGILRDAESIAALIEGYLKSELHRDTGEMADSAYARVDVRGSSIYIRAGSTAPHTIYHELIYHPQLRQTMDVWAPKLLAALKDRVSS